MKTILITGATRGLGLVLTEQCVKNGFRVIASGRQETKELIDLKNKFDSNQIQFCPFDLESGDGHHAFIKTITSDLGPLYGLINNAAIGLDGVLGTMHDTQVLKMVHVNLTSTILLTKYALRSMLTKKEGRIINISSIIGHTGFNGLSVYAATKSGLIGFTRSLARELGKAQITVNAVCPGYMATEMTHGIQSENLQKIMRRSPLGRLITPKEVAIHVGLLLSDQSKSVTGSIFTLDAGSTA